MERDDLGEGPPVVLVHGVAFGPSAFARTAAALRPHARVIVVHRRGYGRSREAPAGAGPEDHAADLLALLDHLDIERAGGLGVSGGATILTAFALAHPERCGALVLHEPALGPLAPGLHALLDGLAHAVSAAPSDAAAADLVASTLAGPATWGALGASGRAEVRRSAAMVCREMPRYAEFAPSASDLRRLRPLQVVTSVGARSGSERRVAAAVLARSAGALTRLVPDAGNLAHLENPLALADLVRSQLGRRERPEEPGGATLAG